MRQSTYRHDTFSDWGCGVKFMVWICSVVGPLMVVGGVVFLVLAVKDPAANAVKEYNHNVGLWTQAGGGFLIFQAAFMGPDFPVQLTQPQIFPTANSTGMPGKNLEIELTASDGVSLLANQGDGYTTYQQSLFFAGALPIFTAGDGPTWIIQPVYEPNTQIPITGYVCASVSLNMPCAEISPPPPPAKPPPPPVITDYFLTNTTMGVNPYLTRQRPDVVVVLPSPPPPPPTVDATESVVYVAVPPAYTAALPGVVTATRKLLQEAPSMCTVYYRQVSFLTEITVTASLPDSCGGGYCDNNTWVYSLADDCGLTYTPVNVPITETQYTEDVSDGYSWCAEWWEDIPPTQIPTSMMYVRSSTDPYVLAGGMTNCSFAFDSASEQYANMGFFFLVPGLAVSLVSYFCLEGVCTPKSMGSSTSTPLVTKAATTYEQPPYGATTAVEMIGRGMVPAGSWNDPKRA